MPAVEKSGCRPLLVFAIGLLTVVITAGLLFVVTRQFSKSVVMDEIASLQAAGEPTSPAELNQYFTRSVEADPTSADPRLASQWLRAIQFVEIQSFQDAVAKLPYFGGETSIPNVGVNWPEQHAAEDVFATFASEISELRRLAMQLGPVRYTSDYSRIHESIPMDFSRLRNVARLLALDAQLAAHNGDTQRYVAAMTGLIRISDSQSHEPAMIGMLMRMAIESIAANVAQQTIPYVELDQRSTEALMTVLADRRHLQHLQRSLRGERALAIDTFLNLPRFMSFPSRYGDLAYYLDVVDRMMLATGRNLQDTWTTIHNEQESQASTSGVTKLFRTLSILSLPAMEASVRAVIRAEFLMDACRVALAMEAYRRQHSVYPNELDDLVPELLSAVPVDPFDGRLIRYRTTPHGYVLYSVGDDLRDDGGQMQQDGRPDFVFEVPKVED